MFEPYLFHRERGNLSAAEEKARIQREQVELVATLSLFSLLLTYRVAVGTDISILCFFSPFGAKAVMKSR